MATSLGTLSNSAVAMAFGMCIQSKQGTTPPGALAALADELTRRGLLPELLSHFAGDRPAAITLMISVDRVRARRSR